MRLLGLFGWLVIHELSVFVFRICGNVKKSIETLEMISRANYIKTGSNRLASILVWLWLVSPPIFSALLLLTKSVDSLLLELLLAFAKLMLLKLLLLRLLVLFGADFIMSDAWFNCVWSFSWKCGIFVCWLVLVLLCGLWMGVALPWIWYETILNPSWLHQQPSVMAFLAWVQSTMTTKRWNHCNLTWEILEKKIRKIRQHTWLDQLTCSNKKYLSIPYSNQNRYHPSIQDVLKIK